MANKLDLKFDTTGLKDTLMNFIVPLVCVGISGLLGLFIIYPAIRDTPGLKQSLQDKQALKAQLTTKVAVLNRMSDYKSVVEEDLTLLNRVLVNEDNVPFLLNQIDTITRSAGLNLTRLNYGLSGGGSIEGATTSFVAVNLGATGTYDQLILFLQKLENAARLIDVSNYRFSEGSGSETAAGLGLSFLLSSPYLAVNSSAATDTPIDVDIADKGFVDLMNYIKTFTFYENSLPQDSLPVAEEKPLSEVLTEGTAESTPAAGGQ